ncbi:MAG: hypothetical protein CM1200mP20_04450 [Pseudomonadota bacterium]|nr:MAG: hypothetical protein CM1200mP20_04450 [Pseudomonadota bacterium]
MIQAIDLHACGEPGRVIVGGVLDVPGRSMFEKMRYLETEGRRSAQKDVAGTAGLPRSQL